MALSSYNTLAAEFTITERVIPSAQAGAEAQRLSAELEAMLLPLKKYQDEPDSPAADAAWNALWDSPTYHELVRQETEARTRRVAMLSPSDGDFLSPTSDLSVKVHKNWIYLRSPSMWRPDCGFVGSTIAQVEEGSLRLGGLQIKAVRGPQDGVVVCAYTEEYGEATTITYRGMLGTGHYAHEDGKLVGTLPSTLEWIKTQIGDSLPLFLSAIDLTQLRHFNQGDAFFSGEFGIDTPTNAPGETSEPFISDAIRGFEASSND